MFMLSLDLWMVISIWNKSPGCTSRGGQVILAWIEWTLKEQGRLSKPEGVNFQAMYKFHLGSKSVQQKNKQKALSCGPGGPGSDGEGRFLKQDSTSNMHQSNKAIRRPYLRVGQNLWSCWLLLSAPAQD